MITAHKKNSLTSRRKKSDPGADDVRFVLDEDGRFVYAAEGFAALCGQEEIVPGGQLLDIACFADPDTAMRSSGIFVPGARFIDTVNEGVHTIILDNSAPEVVIRFDAVTGAVGRRYLIGSVADPAVNPALDTKFAKQLLSLVEGKTGAAPIPTGPVINKINEGELHHFLNMSNDMMTISGRDGKFARVNVMFNRLLGYSDQELHRMTFIDLVHPDDRAQVRNCLVGIAHDESDDGKIIDFEARMVASGGHTLWIEWRQKRGDDIIYSVGRDVTDIKMHEEALCRQQARLDEAQAIGHMGHWRWVVGANDMEWSDEIYRIFGVDRKNFVPTVDSPNAMVHKRDVGRVLQAFQRAIIEQNDYEMEFRINRPHSEYSAARRQGD